MSQATETNSTAARPYSTGQVTNHVVRTGKTKSREGKRAWPRWGSASVKQKITASASSENHIGTRSATKTSTGQIIASMSSCPGRSGPQRARLNKAQTGIAPTMTSNGQRFFRQISQRMAQAGAGIK